MYIPCEGISTPADNIQPYNGRIFISYGYVRTHATDLNYVALSEVDLPIFEKAYEFEHGGDTTVFESGLVSGIVFEVDSVDSKKLGKFLTDYSLDTWSERPGVREIKKEAAALTAAYRLLVPSLMLLKKIFDDAEKWERLKAKKGR